MDSLFFRQFWRPTSEYYSSTVICPLADFPSVLGSQDGRLPKTDPLGKCSSTPLQTEDGNGGKSETISFLFCCNKMAERDVLEE
jgi:hypothetical protein